MLGQGVLGPGAEGVDDHIKALQICPGQVEQVFLQDFSGGGLVRLPHHGGDIQAPVHGLFHNEFPGFAIGANYSDFHNGLPPKYLMESLGPAGFLSSCL